MKGALANPTAFLTTNVKNLISGCRAEMQKNNSNRSRLIGHRTALARAELMHSIVDPYRLSCQLGDVVFGQFPDP